jgi:hypothetical protein
MAPKRPDVNEYPAFRDAEEKTRNKTFTRRLQDLCRSAMLANGYCWYHCGSTVDSRSFQGLWSNARSFPRSERDHERNKL